MDKNIVLMLALVGCGQTACPIPDSGTPQDASFALVDTGVDAGLTEDSGALIDAAASNYALLVRGAQFQHYLPGLRPAPNAVCQLANDSNHWRVSFDLQTDHLQEFPEPNFVGEIIRCNQRSIIYFRDGDIFRMGMGWRDEEASDTPLEIDRLQTIEVRQDGWHHYEFVKVSDGDIFYIEIRDEENTPVRYPLRIINEFDSQVGTSIERFIGIIDNLEFEQDRIIRFSFNEGSGLIASSSDETSLLLALSNEFAWISNE